jgi:5'-methylthioadenosine phosphorylase
VCKIAVIGGSGLYAMPGLEGIEERVIKTPFGDASAPIIIGNLEGTQVAFLARHGIGHHISPSEINYRANIYALKSLGVERIVGVSACGSLREDFAPGEIVVPDQLFDFTRERERSFFSRGLVAHLSIAEPFCSNLSEQVYQAVKSTSNVVHKGGAYITIEGPRFSTRIESNTFRSWGMSIIGMTTSPEAFLAREADTVEMVIEILMRNTTVAQQAVKALVKNLSPVRDCSCPNAMADAFITDRSVIPTETRQDLDLLVRKYLD